MWGSDWPCVSASVSVCLRHQSQCVTARPALSRPQSQGRLDLRKSMSQGDSGQSDQSESSAAGSGETADSSTGRLGGIQHVSSLPDV